MEYRQQLSIKNNRTNRYLTMDANNRPYANSSHPFFKHPEATNQNEVFQILNAANQDYAGPIIFQSTVLIYAFNTQQYLCCLQNGEMKFEKLPPQEAVLSKATKFIIYGTSNTKKQITTHDDVVFKFNETNYMIAELTLACSWNGPNISQDSTWKLQKSSSPPVPDWFFTRPHISLSYLSNSEQTTQYLTKKDERKPIGSHSYQIQSIYLVEDLLFAMMSIEGTYIKKRNGTYEYQIEAHLEQTTCDISLQQLVSKILPMCSQHDQIEYYIQTKSKFENGYVSQALCSGLKELMQKYIMMINQLDYEFSIGDLSLQKLWYYVQPSIRIIEALHLLAIQTQKLIGGAQLSKVVELLNSCTDPQVIEMYQFLLQKAFTPYMKQLSDWIYLGKVDDPFEEFIIAEKRIPKSQISTDFRNNYWDARYTLRQNQIPRFLDKYQDILLRTGKYLNVIGDPNPNFNNQLIDNQGHIVQSQDFSHILESFEWANKQIITLLFQKENLIKRLRSIKSFMLFDQGDFFVHFMEAAEIELNKESKDISKEKMESLFDMAIRSVGPSDQFKDDLFCYLDQYTTGEQIYAYLNLKGGDITENKPPRTQKLKGIDLFTLDIKVPWPANLILCRASVVCYQILFRSLFNLHYVAKQLSEAWLNQKALKETGMHCRFAKQNCLLQRMIHLIKSYLYYLSYDVIEKNYVILESKLLNVDNFEEVRTLHTKFIDDCLSESLQTDPQFTKIFNNRILPSCINFSKQIQMQNSKLITVFRDTNVIIDESQTKKQQMKNLIINLISDPQFKSVEEQFRKTFDDLNRELIRQMKYMMVNQKPYLMSLLTRLDYFQDVL